MTNSENMVVLKKIKNFGRLGITPTLHTQKGKYNPHKDGEPSVEPFNSASFPGIKRNLTPEIQNGEWAFDGDFKDLLKIAKKLKLRDKENAVVLPESDFRTNLECPFMNHIKLWTSNFIENGSRALKYDGGLEEFYARTYTAYNKVIKDGTLQSKFHTQDAVFELYSTASKAKAKSKDIDKELEALSALKDLIEDKDKLRIVASILRPTMDVVNVSVAEIKVELIAEAKETKPSARFSGQSPQEYFVSLTKKDNEELAIMSKINKVTSYGGIRRNDRGFTFKGVQILGPKNEIELNQYYLDPANLAELQELEDFITNRK